MTYCFRTPMLVALAGLVFLTGCASRSYTRAYSEVVDDAKSAGLNLPSAEEENERFMAYERDNLQRLAVVLQGRLEGEGVPKDYRLGVSDTVQFAVFDVPELQVSAPINDAGVVTLPLIGPIQAQGSTLDDLRERVAKSLERFVKSPQVIATVTEFGSQKVAVLGAVEKPGAYPLRKGVSSVTEFMSEAGGVSGRAGSFVQFIPSELSGLKADNTANHRARLALKSLESDDNQTQAMGIELPISRLLGTKGGVPLDVPSRGGDVVVVGEAGRVIVDGEVENRGAYDIASGMTLLGALGAAGGISFGAKYDEVELVREVGGKFGRLRRIINLERLVSGEDQDPLIRSGDVVRVPSDVSRRMRFDTVEGIRRFIQFGIGGTVSLVN